MVRLCLQMGKHDELSTPLGTHEPKHSTLKPSQTLAMLLPFQINCKAYSGLKVAIHGTAWPASLLTDKAARSWNPTLHTGQKGLNRKSKMQRIIPGEMCLTGSANKIEMDLNLK